MLLCNSRVITPKIGLYSAIFRVIANSILFLYERTDSTLNRRLKLIYSYTAFGSVCRNDFDLMMTRDDAIVLWSYHGEYRNRCRPYSRIDKSGLG